MAVNEMVNSQVAVQDVQADVVVVRVLEDGSFARGLQALDEVSGGFFARQAKLGNLPRKVGRAVMFVEVEGVEAQRVLVVCADKKKKDLKKAVAQVLEEVKRFECATVALAMFDGVAEREAQLALQWVLGGCYAFEECKSESKLKDGDFALAQVRWVVCACEKGAEQLEGALARALAWAEGAFLTRRLGDLPPNICYPEFLGEQAQALAQEFEALEAQVLGLEELEAMGAGALLGVAQGSVRPPRLITMTYKPKNAKNKKPIVLVGKGVTFDTGGISLKPSAGMEDMKFDMGGAAAVFGAMRALCYEGLDVYVIGVVASVENMPDGRAYRPGDILTSLSGKTIEVLNTDAEGRLILCDALTYVERFEPQAVVDLATLTGACVVALGGHRAAVLGNDKALTDALFEAGETADDPVWPLPMDEEYKEVLKSPFADLPNISSDRGAGTIVAAAFLGEFAKNYSWAHLDIAGVAWAGSGRNKASGRPVALLLAYLRDVAKGA